MIKWGGVLKRIVAAILSLIMLAGILSVFSVSAQGTDAVAEFFTSPTCTTLTDTTDSQDRWLSVPDSRLVVNPYDFNLSATATQSDYSNRPSVPLNIGFASPYAVRRERIILNDVVGHLEKSPDAVSNIMFDAPAEEWYPEDPRYGYTTVLDNGDLYCVNTADADPIWQRFHAGVFSAEVTENTVLSFEIVEKNDGVSCKISMPEGEWTDYSCSVNGTGLYEFRVADVIGRTGSFRLRVDFYCVGSGAHMTIRNVTVADSLFDFSSGCTFANNPAVNRTSAVFPDGNTMSVTDCFADETTVLRNVKYAGSENAYIFGKIYGDAEVTDGCLTVDMGNYAYVISCDKGSVFGFFDGFASAVSGGKGSFSPEGCNYYLMKITGDEANIYFTLDTKYSRSKDGLVAHSKEMQTENSGEVISGRIAYWDDILAKIPVPGKFGLTVPGAENTNQRNIEKMYYKSWTLIYASVLPQSPETDYPYRTMANGKPGLWSEGGKHSQYVAMWDSVYAIRMLAYLDGGMAWDCFEGLMADVEEDGSISGEGLPDQKAHTLWHIYSICPDRERLADVMDVMERHTEFSLNHTYWIYPTYNPDPAIKDVIYTTALADEALYLNAIYTELGNSARAEYWADFADSYRLNIIKWHFNNGRQYDFCIPKGNTLSRFSYDYSVLSSGGQGLMYVKGLRANNRKILKDEFLSKYDASAVNGGFSGITAQSPLYMMYGYAQYGEKDISKTVCEVTIRDVSQTVMPAERCDTDTDGTPVCGGVRPSFFTAALMIESVFLRNNVRMDDGLPSAYSLFDSGRVSNIHIGSKVYDITVSDGKAAVSGDADIVTEDLSEAHTYLFGKLGKGAYLVGDVNGSGEVTVTDVLQVLRMSLKLSAVPQGAGMYPADANGDRKITVADAAIILGLSVQND